VGEGEKMPKRDNEKFTRIQIHIPKEELKMFDEKILEWNTIPRKLLIEKIVRDYIKEINRR
jgi:metal-responsive CopG/Arc/MetJ family transcriptional regulator